ncbi:hypothetical protein J2T57_001397 [Natronocella acetinitrilica]|uniref:Uncharacterized protein n=1 Tax=Natronocella acetinitrilica TaxID=414046 RepID=A0AAE3G244_9GAMM|nr:hypothetical protein [Natronocella acetinitrilica]MCP1674295.1 hypothetical protein [Natronocella acetinitrilica]
MLKKTIVTLMLMLVGLPGVAVANMHGLAIGSYLERGEYRMQLPAFTNHWSRHHNRDFQWNEMNEGAGVQLTLNGGNWRESIVIGVLEDSFYSWGGYAGYTRQYIFAKNGFGHISGGAFVGAAYRAMSVDGGNIFLPMALPTLTIEAHRGIGLNITGLPDVGDSFNGMLHVQITVPM